MSTCKLGCFLCHGEIPSGEEHYEQEVSEGNLATVCGECLEPSIPYAFWCEDEEDYINPNHGDCDCCDFYDECERRHEFRIPS